LVQIRTLVQIRRVLARRPWLVWSVVVLVSVLAATVVDRQSAAAVRARRAWGDRRVVLVATVPVAAGTPVGAASLATRSLPTAALPDHTVDRADRTAVVTRSLERGEVLVPADLATGDPRFALVGPGQVVVAVPRPAVMVPVIAGDSVLITLPGGSSGGSPGGSPGPSPAVVPAIVVTVSETSVVLAVAAEDAPAVAVAGSGGADTAPSLVLTDRPARVGSP
jgi:hypothetical protein